MVYIKTIWVDDVTPPVDEDNLNKIEDALYALLTLAIVHRYKQINAATYLTTLFDYRLGVIYNATAPVTVTLATAACNAGQCYYIVDEAGNAQHQNITIDTEGTELIKGSATCVISTNWDKRQFYSNGTDWFIC